MKEKTIELKSKEQKAVSKEGAIVEKLKRQDKHIKTKNSKVVEIKLKDGKGNSQRDIPKTLMKTKRTKSNEKKAKTAPPPPIAASRNFSTDLLMYLSTWASRSIIPWKFNKVLQNWALEHYSDSSKIDGAIFELLIPYLESVQGVARDRLIQTAQATIENLTVESTQIVGTAGDEEDIHRANEIDRKIRLARLQRIVKLLK